MPLQPAITDLEQLKNHPAVAKLVAWNPAAVEGAKFDRDEMSIYVERSLHSRRLRSAPRRRGLSV